MEMTVNCSARYEIKFHVSFYILNKLYPEDKKNLVLIFEGVF